MPLEKKIEMIETAAITAGTDPYGKESERRKDETAVKSLTKVTGHNEADCTEFIAMFKLPGVSTIQAYYVYRALNQVQPDGKGAADAVGMG